MKTKSIIDLLEIQLGFKENYIKAELDKVDKLIINRFDANKELIEVDFNDLKLFSNLKELTVNECMLGYDNMNIISNLKNLKKLFLINCDVAGEISIFFETLNINCLVVDNTNIDLDIYSKLNFESLILLNIKIDSNIVINSINLDIRECSFDSIEYLNIENVKYLKISFSQYNLYKDFFSNCNCKITVMEDNGEFEYNKEAY